MRKKAMWVTVDGTAARLETTVRSTHRSLDAAYRTVARARRAGHPREVHSAALVARMQAGESYTAAIQALAGKLTVPAYVEV